MRPEDVLPDDKDATEVNGVTVRKGTIGAFMASARVWMDEAVDAAARADAERDMLATLPALTALGIFEMFEVRDPRLKAFVAARSGR